MPGIDATCAKLRQDQFLCLTGACPQFKGCNRYTQNLLCRAIFFVSYRIPKCIGLLASIFRAIVNRPKVYPPLEGLSAAFLVRRFCGGLEGLPAMFVEGWPADHLLAASFT